MKAANTQVKYREDEEHDGVSAQVTVGYARRISRCSIMRLPQHAEREEAGRAASSPCSKRRGIMLAAGGGELGEPARAAGLRETGLPSGR